MFENPRRGRQARNFTTNVPKILVLKSSSEQIFSRKLPLGAPEDVQCALSVHTQFLPIKPKYKIRTTILIKLNSMLRYKNANLAPILLSALAGNALTYSLMHFTPA